jgi:hypothetical protein
MEGLLEALSCSFCLLLIGAIAFLSMKTFGGFASSAAAATRIEREAADARGHELLRNFLGEAEYAQLMERGYLEVASPHHSDRTYRIPLSDGLVQVYDQGELTKRLCLQPTEYLPRSDVVILHTLMITGDEHEYLARANAFPPLFRGW